MVICFSLPENTPDAFFDTSRLPAKLIDESSAGKQILKPFPFLSREWGSRFLRTGSSRLAALSGPKNGILLLGTIGLYYHEFAPGLPVFRFFTLPRKMHLGNVCVRGTRISVASHRLFESVDN